MVSVKNEKAKGLGRILLLATAIIAGAGLFQTKITGWKEVVLLAVMAICLHAYDYQMRKR